MIAARHLAALLLAPAGLAACSDAKAPNAANLRKVIEPVVADSYCLTPSFTRLVQKDETGKDGFPVFLTSKASDFDPGRTGRALLDDGVRMGLAKRTDVEIVAKHAGSTEAFSRQSAIRYEPTASGAGHLRAVRAMTQGGTMGTFAGFCGGTGELVAIERRTEPADIFGQHVAQVTYTQKGSDPIAGISDTAKAALEKVQEKTVSLVLMSDGWQVMLE